MKFPINITKNEIHTFSNLKKVAWYSLSFQTISLFIYLFCFAIIRPSNQIAVVCGFLAILTTLLPIIYALLRKQFILIFSCIAVFNLAPIWFLYLESILPGYDAYEFSPAKFRIEALIWVSIFHIFVNFFYILLWKKVTHFSIKIFSFLNTFNVSANFYTKLSYFSFLIPLTFFSFYYPSFDSLWTAFTAGRSVENAGGLIIQDSKGLNSYMLPLNWFWILTPLFSSVAFVSQNKKTNLKAILPIILGLIVVFQTFLGGTRAMLIFVSTPFLFFLFYYNWNRGLKFWGVATLIFFALVGTMEFQLRFRDENFLDVISNIKKAEKEKGLSSATTLDITHSHRDNNMYLFCLLIDGYPKKYHFEGYNELFAELGNPIPRVFWRNKPVLQGAKDLEYQYPAVEDGPLFMGTTNLTYSIVGEAYLAGGAIGLFWYALIYSLFIVFFDGMVYYSKSKKPICIGILGSAVFLSFFGYRALFALVSYIYPLLLFIILLRLFMIIKPNHKIIY